MTSDCILHIRAAEPSDADELTVLTNLPGVRRGTLRLPYTPRAMIEGRLASGSGHHFLVGSLPRVGGGQDVVAHGILMPRSGRMAHVGEVILTVHDSHVGQGHGTAMLAALLDLADNWLGLRRLELDVYVDNASAIRLYERNGFEIEGTKRGDSMREGTLVDSHIMGRLRSALERKS